MLNITESNPVQLLAYVDRQLHNFFPDQQLDTTSIMARHFDETLTRLQTCINSVKLWKQDEFDYLHSSQYCIFLYYLSNTIWRNEQQQRLCTKLFYLNKALNGIDLFYEIDMPEKFFIGHSAGIVLAKAQYSNYLVLYQGVTVGKNHGAAPMLGERVILYPNSAVIGACEIADGSVIAQGVSVTSANTPGNCLCFQGDAGALLFKTSERDIIADFFRF